MAGTFNEFRIYSGVMDPAGVTASFAAGPDSGFGPSTTEILDFSYDKTTGSVSFSWNAAVGASYTLQYSADLNLWTTINENFQATESLQPFTETNYPKNLGKLFFRVIPN